MLRLGMKASMIPFSITATASVAGFILFLVTVVVVVRVVVAVNRAKRFNIFLPLTIIVITADVTGSDRDLWQWPGFLHVK